MALRDQPYLPLYVQDFLTDEKLLECSAASIGMYIMIMCVMHKSKEYGTILLKQKDKQNTNQEINFAFKLAKHLPFSVNDIKSAIHELVSEDVLQLNGDKLSQKRMIKDNQLSLTRAKAGKKGGKKTQFAKAKHKANGQAIPEYENENDILINKLKKNSEIFNDCQMKTGLDGDKLESMLIEWQMYYKDRFEDYPERAAWQLRSSFIEYAKNNKVKSNGHPSGRNYK